MQCSHRPIYVTYLLTVPPTSVELETERIFSAAAATPVVSSVLNFAPG